MPELQPAAVLEATGPADAPPGRGRSQPVSDMPAAARQRVKCKVGGKRLHYASVTRAKTFAVSLLAELGFIQPVREIRAKRVIYRGFNDLRRLRDRLTRL